MYGYIYKIKNKINHKIYVGQTTSNPKIRKRAHFTTLRQGVHNNMYLQRAFNKHGESSFSFHVLDSANDKESLNKLEISYIEKYQCLNRDKGYNLKEGGGNGKHSPESIRKMINAKKGVKLPPFSVKHRENLSKNHAKYWLGKQIGKYRGTTYAIKKGNPWRRVWNAQIMYNQHRTSLGYYNDPISGEIVFKIVWDEIYHSE